MNTLKDRFTLYFTGLKAALATTSAMPKAKIAFLEMVFRYVLGLAGRLERLVTRWQNGTLPKRRAPRPPRAPVEGRKRAPAPFRLPHGRDWLMRRVPGIGFCGSRLSHLLANDEQMQAFLEAAPQARRLINPLCRMFGIDIDNPLGGAPAHGPPTVPAEPTAASAANLPPRPPRPPRRRREKSAENPENYSPGPCRLFSTP